MNKAIPLTIPWADSAEAAVFLVFLAIAIRMRGRRWPQYERWEKALLAACDRLNHRPWVAALAVGGLAGGLRLLLLPWVGYPLPNILDEYCYLLASDTFAHGRLTNPTHPLAVFFESLSLIQFPSYSSKYPPGQGLVMALGQVVTGHPWWGVWLSTVVACALFYWTLAGWVPRRWALFGGVLAVLRWGIFSYWMNSYWGGALTAIGGCLVLGSIPRFRRKPGMASALLFGTGLAILANTRPYEGAVFGGAVLVVWLLLKPKFRSQILPLALVLALTAAGMCYFFWRVTGNPFLMPYMEHERQYAPTPSFVFLPPRPPIHYTHPMMEAMWKIDGRAYHLAHTPLGFLRWFTNKVLTILTFYIGPALLVSVGALFLLRNNRRTRWLAGLLGVMFLGTLATAWTQPHYIAPATIVILLLLVQGLRVLRLHPQWGAILLRCILLACMVRTGLCLHNIGRPLWRHSDLWRCSVNEGSWEHVLIRETVEKAPGKQLVIVEYGNHQPHFEEYVYNLADIDGQHVVWARSMGAAKDTLLLDYYKDRQVWLLSVYANGYELRAYPEIRR